MSHEDHFASFRKYIIGIDTPIHLPDIGETRKLLYADWIASGRLYGPIEEHMREVVGPYVANTHTETTLTGQAMTEAYHKARTIIKNHVNAGEQDCLFLTGNGMTAAVNKLQRLLGLRIPESAYSPPSSVSIREPDAGRPIVLITHMEHHSNQITWEECNVDILIVPHNPETGLPDLDELEKMAKQYRSRPLLIGAFTAGSNVTGITTPYHEMAGIMHRYGGKCFVDFAAAAPYVPIDMHPEDPGEHLDAIMFSPHKFLGGPGTSGVLIMNSELYHNTIPDIPGGGTVRWTNPYGAHIYFDDIEMREDGGTPGFLQAIRVALTLQLKERMDPLRIQEREEELLAELYSILKTQDDIFILEGHNRRRLGVISFFTRGVHHNLFVRLLNDRFGIQTRGGCSCAGTYGHILFHINKPSSIKIADMISGGDLSEKPGWVRVSLHPTMTSAEVRMIGNAIVAVVQNAETWGRQYRFDKHTGDYLRIRGTAPTIPDVVASIRWD